MKIAFFEVEDWEKEYIKKGLENNKILFVNDKLNNENVKLVSDFDIISVFIYSNIDKNILNRFNKLKAIVTRSTGFDHIDINECKKRKINVFNVPSYGENTVAEHTFALILSLSRKIHKSYERTIRGNFSLEGLRGFDLKGKTIGIIGLGKIGKNVARIAKGFGMKIITYDPIINKKIEKEIGLKFVSLNYLLKNSDIITFHCPYNKKTHHLLNKKNIIFVKEDSIIINTSRGGIIDTEALVRSLTTGKVKGAGLDVLEEESMIREERQLLSTHFQKENLKRLIENHILLTFDNVLITPHNAFNSKEALERILDVTIDNINDIINKKKSPNIVKI